jgi:hypothetical protein
MPDEPIDGVAVAAGEGYEVSTPRPIELSEIPQAIRYLLAAGHATVIVVNHMHVGEPTTHTISAGRVGDTIMDLSAFRPADTPIREVDYAGIEQRILAVMEPDYLDIGSVLVPHETKPKQLHADWRKSIKGKGRP